MELWAGWPTAPGVYLRGERNLLRQVMSHAAVRELATGGWVRLAWENQDALTFEVG
jgi:hypothetical protein